ncbi:MAG: HNH endonuclease [Anaeromyxobacter sp.]|nr:HNH endonuclease [Anaeromyxobacter sp.]
MMPITLDEIRARVANIRSWKKGSQVAPHKPLLLLYALGRLQTGKERLVAFAEASGPLKEMLEEFGPRRRSYHTEFPFWHLRSDRLRELTADVEVKPKPGDSSVTAAALRSANARGGLPQDVFGLLQSNPQVVFELAMALLATNFAETLHGDILAAVGLAVYTGSARLPRDPRFREAVLDAYGRACAVCGFDIRLGTVSLAVEAAHIRWHQHGGPSSVDNGLCLCSSHHKIFDLGGFTLSADWEIEIAGAVVQSESAVAWLWSFDGKPLRLPKRDGLRPAAAYIAWHRKGGLQDRH